MYVALTVSAYVVACLIAAIANGLYFHYANKVRELHPELPSNLSQGLDAAAGSKEKYAEVVEKYGPAFNAFGAAFVSRNVFAVVACALGTVLLAMTETLVGFLLLGSLDFFNLVNILVTSAVELYDLFNDVGVEGVHPVPIAGIDVLRQAVTIFYTPYFIASAILAVVYFYFVHKPGKAVPRFMYQVGVRLGR